MYVCMSTDGQLHTPSSIQIPTTARRFTSRASAVPNKYFSPYPRTPINPLLLRTLVSLGFRTDITSNSNFWKLLKSASSSLVIIPRRLTSPQWTSKGYSFVLFCTYVFWRIWPTSNFILSTSAEMSSRATFTTMVHLFPDSVMSVSLKNINPLILVSDQLDVQFLL
jgi:hypothetical protein